MTSRLLSFINQSRTIFSADQIDNTVFLIGHSIHIIRLKSLNRKKKLYPQDEKHNFISYFFYFSTPQKHIEEVYTWKKSFELHSFFCKDSSALNFQQICKELLVQLIHITQLPGYTVVQNYTLKYRALQELNFFRSIHIQFTFVSGTLVTFQRKLGHECERNFNHFFLVN